MGQLGSSRGAIRRGALRNPAAPRQLGKGAASAPAFSAISIEPMFEPSDEIQSRLKARITRALAMLLF